MRTTSRKAISILLSSVMALTILPLSVFATGEDTTSSVTDLTTPVEPEKVSDVYQIGTTNELYWYANTINATQSPSSDDFKAILTADINFNPGVTFEYQAESGCIAVRKMSEDGQQLEAFLGTGLNGTENGVWLDGSDVIELNAWIPIYNMNSNFNGNGHTIDGVYVNCAEQTAQINFSQFPGYIYGAPGFFGYIGNGGSVNHLKIGANSCVVSNQGTAGGVAGVSSGLMYVVENHATVVGFGAGTTYEPAGVGGIVGKLRNHDISNCINYGTVIGVLKTTYSQDQPSYYRPFVGGIAGGASNSTSGTSVIASSINFGNVYAEGGYAAGILSRTTNTTQCTGDSVLYCANYGNVEGMHAAGVVDYAVINTIVELCANYGAVTGTAFAAGVIGETVGGELRGCFNAGPVRLTDTYPASDSYFRSNSYSGAFALVAGSGVTSEDVTNGYNDADVCPAELFREYYGSDAPVCYSVPQSTFTSGEVGYKLNQVYSSSSRWMVQRLADPGPSEEDPRPAETYPRLNFELLGCTTDNIYRNTHWCCAGINKTNHTEDKRYTYANVTHDATVDDHIAGSDGYCAHCGLDMRAPTITGPETIDDITAGVYYYESVQVLAEGAADITFELTKIEVNGVEITDENLNDYDVYFYITNAGYLTLYSNVTGTVNLTVTATNGYGSDTETFTVTVLEGEQFEILTQKLPDGKVGEEYYAFLEASQKGAYWEVDTKSSPLPAGLEFNGKSGEITGTPTESGYFKVIVYAYYEKDVAETCLTLYIAPADEAHTHTYSWKEIDSVQHIGTCSCGDSVTEDHTWNQGVETTAPTIEVEGEMTYTCTKCGATKTEPVPKLHRHEFAGNTCVNCETQLFEFAAQENGVTITTYNGYDSEILFPETVEGAVVLGIGDNAFQNQANITAVIILDENFVISEFAFLNSAVTTIYGYTGSTAETYAEAHFMTFVALDKPTGVGADLNMDGVANLTDYAVMAAMSIGEQTASVVETRAGDLNFDGVVDFFDVALLDLIINGYRYLPGDLNGDGNLNDADLTLINNAIDGTAELTQKQTYAADLNGDGLVNATDAALLEKRILLFNGYTQAKEEA